MCFTLGGYHGYHGYCPSPNYLKFTLLLAWDYLNFIFDFGPDGGPSFYIKFRFVSYPIVSDTPKFTLLYFARLVSVFLCLISISLVSLSSWGLSWLSRCQLYLIFTLLTSQIFLTWERPSPVLNFSKPLDSPVSNLTGWKVFCRPHESSY